MTTGRDNGTWHEEMGYGLVDAYAAVPKVVSTTLPKITGPEFPILNFNVTYGISSSLPTGVTFNGWSVASGTSHTVTGGTTGSTLNVKFTEVGEPSVSANFTLPSGAAYSLTKTIIVSTAPTLSWEYFSLHHSTYPQQRDKRTSSGLAAAGTA